MSTSNLHEVVKDNSLIFDANAEPNAPISMVLTMARITPALMLTLVMVPKTTPSSIPSKAIGRSNFTYPVFDSIALLNTDLSK